MKIYQCTFSATALGPAPVNVNKKIKTFKKKYNFVSKSYLKKIQLNANENVAVYI